MVRFRKIEGSFLSFVELLESFESRFPRFFSSFVYNVKCESPGDERVDVFRLLPLWLWYSRASGLRSGDEGSSMVLRVRSFSRSIMHYGMNLPRVTRGRFARLAQSPRKRTSKQTQPRA